MKWTECCQNLPEELKDVLITNGKGFYAIGNYYKDFEGRIHWNERGGTECNDITHWMTIPSFEG